MKWCFCIGNFHHPNSLSSDMHDQLASVLGILSGRLTLPVIILNSLTNPVFEESLKLVTGSPRCTGLEGWVALDQCSFRAALHNYQGFTGMYTIFTMRVLFWLVYWR